MQLAKALGAAHVVTAATGAGIEFALSLGAEEVADYEVCRKAVFRLAGIEWQKGRVTTTTTTTTRTTMHALENFGVRRAGIRDDG